MKAKTAMCPIRLLPDARRQDMLSATLKILRREGPSGVTVRKICEEAQISLGMISLHFGGRDELIAQSYELAEAQYVDAFHKNMAAADLKSQDPLRIFIESYLSRHAMRYQELRMWTAFWELYPRYPRMNELRLKTAQTYSNHLEDLLRPILENAEECRLTASGLISFLDGIWLSHCLSPNTVTREASVDLALKMLAPLRRSKSS